MNCPNCGAALRLEPGREFLTCDYCRHVHLPQPDDDGIRILEEAAKEKCPLCAVSLVHAAIGGVRILYCTRCRGMLIPMEHFLTLIEVLRAERDAAGFLSRPAAPESLERRIRCPRCSELMATHPYYGGPGNVIIDNCLDCGVNWLDHSELTRIVAACSPQSPSYISPLED